MPNTTGVLSLILGVILPILPVLLFDMRHGFVNSKNMIQYILVDQQKISLDVLGRRWKTFIGIFLPTEWAHIIGGKTNISSMLMIGSFVMLPIVYKFKKDRIIQAIILSTAAMFCILRYTHAPLFSSYVVFLHPFILLLSSLVIYIIYKKILYWVLSQCCGSHFFYTKTIEKLIMAPIYQISVLDIGLYCCRDNILKQWPFQYLILNNL
jgi:hypothetical protein